MGYPLTKVTEARDAQMLAKSMEFTQRQQKDEIYDNLTQSLLVAKTKGTALSEQSLADWKNQLASLDVEDEGAILSAVTDRYVSATTAARALPSSSGGLAILDEVSRLYPGVSLPVQHPLTRPLLMLSLAGDLGLLQKQVELLGQIGPALQQAGVDASLIQKGLNPRVLQALSSGSIPSGLRLQLPRNVQLGNPLPPSP